MNPSLVNQKALVSQKDEVLLQAYLYGSEEAFQELYRRYSGKVYGYLCRRISDRQVLDDLFQMVFLKLHQSRTSYKKEYLLSQWVFMICKSTMIDHFRKQGREMDRMEEYRQSQDLEERPGESLKEEGLELRGVGQVLEGLPKNQKVALSLRYERDSSFEEIASQLNTSPANARKLISRGLKKIRTLLGAKQRV
jgi:RNA polymerase sigma factor (sigma-70 family)